MFQDEFKRTELCRLAGNARNFADTVGDIHRGPSCDACTEANKLMNDARDVGILEKLIETPDNLGITPLWNASFTGHLGIVESLIKNNAAIDRMIIDGQTPLMRASINTNSNTIEIIELLLRHKADIHARCKKNETALSRAAENGRKETVKILLMAGAQIDQLSVENYTVLHMVAKCKYIVDGIKYVDYHGIVEWLLTQPIAKTIINNASNDHHHTPLTCAIEHNGDLKMVKLLVSGGADTSIEGGKGLTPLEWAIDTGKKDIEKYLESVKAP